MPNDLCEVAEMTEPAPPTCGNARPSLLRHYEAIASASSAMLAAARAGDWIEVRDRRSSAAPDLDSEDRDTQSETTLGAIDDARRMQLLRQILFVYAQIRGHAEPWLEPLAPYISSPRPPGADEAT